MLVFVWPLVKIQIVAPVNIRFNPTTKIGSTMGGEFTYPKMVPLVLTHSHMGRASKLNHQVMDRNLSAWVHVPGQAILGLPMFDPRPHGYFNQNRGALFQRLGPGTILPQRCQKTMTRPTMRRPRATRCIGVCVCVCVQKGYIIFGPVFRNYDPQTDWVWPNPILLKYC